MPNDDRHPSDQLTDDPAAAGAGGHAHELAHTAGGPRHHEIAEIGRGDSSTRLVSEAISDAWWGSLVVRAAS